MFQKTFSGSKLRNRRREVGLSPTDLAYRVNRSYNSIRAYETGAVTPPPEVVQAIADVLKLPADAFYSEAPDA